MHAKAVIAIAALSLLAGAAQAQRFPAAASFDAAGPYKVDSRPEGPDCTVFVPTTLGQGGRKHPVIVWGNGTRSKVPAYAPMLTQWASHGFVVIAANTNSAGSGKPLLDCLDYLEKAPAYAGKLDLAHIGASGHSQGGGGTLMAARDKRFTATAPIQAYTLGLGYEAAASAAQHAPILLLSGGADTTAVPATNQAPVFAAAKVPVFWATLKDAAHSVPATGDSGQFRVITTAWFRWKLMGDERAGLLFEGPKCGVCTDERWAVQVK